MSKLDLEQQRKRAKELRRAHAAGDVEAAERILRHFPRARGRTEAAILAAPFTLSDAQLVVAREAGYPSWPAMVHAAKAGDDDALLEAALRGAPSSEAAARSIHLAAAFGDVAAVHAHLAHDPALADVRGGGRGWTPLLYACCARGAEPQRIAIARELLAGGADANAVGHEPGYASANVGILDEYTWHPLEGAAGRVASAALIELLVAHGADAKRTSTLLTRAVQSGRADVVRTALAANPPWWQVTWALCACVELSVPIELARLLVAAAVLPSVREPALLDAIRLHRDAGLVDVLLGEIEITAWRSAYRAAARHDHTAVRALLERRGASEAWLTDADRAVAAAVRGEADASSRAAFSDDDHRMLTWAIRNGRLAAVPRLLALGLDPNVADSDGDTPLHLAVRLADAVTIDALLAAGARSDARDYDAQTPRMLALALPDVTIRERLRADPGSSEAEPVDPELFERAADAVAFGDLATLRALLAAEPALVHARSPRPHRATLLHYCGANGIEDPRQRTPANAPDIAELLLAAGADPDATCKLYRGPATTLHLLLTSAIPRAAELDGALVTALARHGARVTSGDLVTAILHGSPRAVAALVAAGVPVADPFAAAGTNDIARLRAFLAAGADPNARYADGATALHAAAALGHVEAARCLLEHGADPTLRDDAWDNRPADTASYFEHAELATLLEA